MLTYEEALKIVQEQGAQQRMGAEVLSLVDSVGRVCASAVQASIDIQPFDNSAMDGFAVSSSDLAKASQAQPVSLLCVSTSAAGDAITSTPLSSGSCVEIMTGAPVPAGVDAVVPVELVKLEGERVFFSSPVRPGENVRMAGEDFRKGEVALNPGEFISPRHIMPLATLGVETVEVYRRPKVALIATGRELVDDLGQSLEPGQIYNSNGPYAKTVLEAFGAECRYWGTITDDDPDSFSVLIDRILEDRPDLIISSGAVSAGKYDFVRSVLEKKGAGILFHKVKIKPGKPNLFACFPGGGPLYFGLPGNPVATAAGLRFFVWPLLRSMWGLEPERVMRCSLANDFFKKIGLRMFLKAKVTASCEGVLSLTVMEGQQSFMVSPFLGMNAWAVALEQEDQIEAGQEIAFYPFMPGSLVLD